MGPNTERNIPVSPKTKPEQYIKNRNQLNFLIAHISNDDVLDIINQLENKSTGPQSIPIKLNTFATENVYIRFPIPCKKADNVFIRLGSSSHNLAQNGIFL